MTTSIKNVGKDSMVLYVMGWRQEFGVPIDDPEAYMWSRYSSDLLES